QVSFDVGTSAGLKTVYFKVRDHAGFVSSVISDTITKGDYSDIPATIPYDLVLKKEQNPFRIRGTVTVNAKLTVQAGVQVYFDEYLDGMGTVSGVLVVNGPFVVAGTGTGVTEQVVFVGDNDGMPMDYGTKID